MRSGSSKPTCMNSQRRWTIDVILSPIFQMRNMKVPPPKTEAWMWSRMAKQNSPDSFFYALGTKLRLSRAEVVWGGSPWPCPLRGWQKEGEEGACPTSTLAFHQTSTPHPSLSGGPAF